MATVKALEMARVKAEALEQATQSAKATALYLEYACAWEPEWTAEELRVLEALEEVVQLALAEVRGRLLAEPPDDPSEDQSDLVAG